MRDQACLGVAGRFFEIFTHMLWGLILWYYPGKRSDFCFFAHQTDGSMDAEKPKLFRGPERSPIQNPGGMEALEIEPSVMKNGRGGRA
jgi:hypothetical protein